MAERTKVCDKVFVLADGTEVRHAQPGIVRAEFRFADGEMLEVTADQLTADIQAASMWHGIAQKVGDSYAGKAGDEATEAALAVIERLASGEWVRAREGGGPRPSLVVDAIVAALQKAGQTVDEARKASIAEKVKGNDARKAALRDPHIAAEYERIRAERAAEKAAKLAEKAADAESTDLSNF